MVPELGHVALILALGLSIVLAIVPITGAALGDSRLMAVARPVAIGQFGFLMISFLCLVWAFVYNDFTVEYVAQNSNTQLPVRYRVSAVWGGHEGSLLLWAFILSGWTMAVALFSGDLPRELLARVLGVMGIIAVGFLLFLQITSNPFERLLPGFPLDGRDLNPLLQDVGLIVHPPMLYMGYVGFSVAFAFVVGALLGGRLDSSWARWSRPWTTVAWAFLTIGITLGSWWAYYELGWGGWWFWDPVENASFMPWLVGTALIHSLAATEKRGVFRAWTVLLAITAFSLSLLGTFLVRSGVLTSVHAFANDPSRGLFILAILTVITGGALTLLVVRAGAIRSEGRFSLWSRETMLLSNNILLAGAACVVFTGTLYPLVIDILDLGKISVGPPYFNALFVPLALSLMLALGIGPMLRWKGHSVANTFRRRAPMAGVSVALGAAVPFLMNGEFQFLVALSAMLVFWVALTSFEDVHDKIRNKNKRLASLLKLPRSYKGMILAHLGVAVCATGVALSSAYSVERDVRLAVGESAEVGPYTFRLLKLSDLNGPNYRGTAARLEVFDANGELYRVMTPEKRLYLVQQTTMTEVALDPGLTRDLYVALGESLGNGAWAVRIHYKPFVRWIWLGGLLMASGGVLAIRDRRYRLATSPKSAFSNQPGEATDVTPT